VLDSSPRKYVDPSGAYTASHAPLWRRGLAGAIDWGLAGVAYLVALIVAGVFQAVGDAIGGSVDSVVFWISEVAAVGVILAYFTGFLASGHTLGMRALDIHVRSGATGQPPGLGRAFLRSLLGLGFAIGALNAYAYLQGTSPVGELTSVQEAVGRAAVGVVVVAAAGQLWMLADPSGRTVWDRLTGLVVVEDIVPSRMPDRLWAPWRP
jgi:uncharacterized RDD family membrane protein YckC